MTEKTKDQPLFTNFTVEKVVELNFFDLTGEKAKTKGSANRQYLGELQIEKNGVRAQIYTMWGPTGGTQTKDWRHYQDQDRARKEFESIIKSKKRKGYKEIDVAQRAYGSEEAKQIVKNVDFNNIDPNPSSNLHIDTQRLIRELMGSTNQFVVKTLLCPLGQLTNAQIDLGRQRLNEAKEIINTSKDKKELENLTNDFYSLIPHNLGSGSRGKMIHLLIDDLTKVATLQDELDTLLDAKSVGAALTSNSIEDQYKSLNSEFNYINHQDPLFKWIEKIVLETRASNHRQLGKINVLNAWGVKRNREYDIFINSAKKIAKECGNQIIPDALRKHVPNRIDLDEERKEIYKLANVLPLFHGTKTQNIVGIVKNGLLIKPAGVILTGSYFGIGNYFATNSSKSLNYSSLNKAIYSNDNKKYGYLFLNDCVLGNQLITKRSYQYNKQNIKPNHSVWAKGGADLINDEYILYETTQHNIRYLIEVYCD